MQELDDSNFDSSVSTGVVLVDFWAPWCGPCRALTPTLERVADAFKEKAAVVKLNIDQNPEVTTKFAIRSIPTLVVFKDGVPVDSIVGTAPESKLKEMLEHALNA